MKKKKYNDPTGSTCGCGKSAFKRKGGGWVCRTCDALENAATHPGRAGHASQIYTRHRNPLKR